MWDFSFKTYPSVVAMTASWPWLPWRSPCRSNLGGMLVEAVSWRTPLSSHASCGCLPEWSACRIDCSCRVVSGRVSWRDVPQLTSPERFACRSGTSCRDWIGLLFRWARSCAVGTYLSLWGHLPSRQGLTPQLHQQRHQYHFRCSRTECIVTFPPPSQKYLPWGNLSSMVPLQSGSFPLVFLRAGYFSRLSSSIFCSSGPSRPHPPWFYWRVVLLDRQSISTRFEKGNLRLMTTYD